MCVWDGGRGAVDRDGSYAAKRETGFRQWGPGQEQAWVQNEFTQKHSKPQASCGDLLSRWKLQVRRFQEAGLSSNQRGCCVRWWGRPCSVKDLGEFWQLARQGEP